MWNARRETDTRPPPLPPPPALVLVLVLPPHPVPLSPCCCCRLYFQVRKLQSDEPLTSPPSVKTQHCTASVCPLSVVIKLAVSMS